MEGVEEAWSPRLILDLGMTGLESGELLTPFLLALLNLWVGLDTDLERGFGGDLLILLLSVLLLAPTAASVVSCLVSLAMWCRDCFSTVTERLSFHSDGGDEAPLSVARTVAIFVLTELASYVLFLLQI